MKNIIPVCFLFVAFSSFFNPSSYAQNTMGLNSDVMITEAEKIKSNADEIAACINQSGMWPSPRWGYMPNGCVDMCGKEEMACFDALTQGCDCGPKYCYDQTAQKCVPNPQ